MKSFACFCELGYSDDGPNRIERDVIVEGEDSRHDEFANFVLSVRGRRLLAMTISETEEETTAGMLSAAALRLPFFL